MDKLPYLAIGFCVGVILWDQAWRFARRVERKLIDAQRELIAKQGYALDFVERVLAEREKSHEG